MTRVAPGGALGDVRRQLSLPDWFLMSQRKELGAGAGLGAALQ